jgi:hypothetical protein
LNAYIVVAGTDITGLAIASAYAGSYLVRRVTHAIAGGTYTQSFSLSREGTGALAPAVRP